MKDSHRLVQQQQDNQVLLLLMNVTNQNLLDHSGQTNKS